MEFFQQIINLGPTVMMPIIFFLLGLGFGVTPGKAFKAAMTVGIGFLGISLIVMTLLESLGPATQDMVNSLNLKFTVVDAGWAVGASIGWASAIVPFVVIGAIALNVLLLVLNKTRIVNIDIFNYWLILLPGSMVYANTQSLALGTAASLFIYLVAFIIGDKTAPAIQRMYKMEGVAFVHATCGIYVPVGIFVNELIEKIPGLNRIDLSPESVTKKIGILGDPVTLATILGAGMGILAGWGPGAVATLAVQVAAVMILLPKMVGVTVEGVMVVREAAEIRLKKWFPHKDFYIGMDTALLIGEPCIIATGLLLIPTAVVLAIILPGNLMLPFVDLASLVFLISMVAPFCKRNMFRIYLTGCVILAVCLYAGTSLSSEYTAVANIANVSLPESVSSTKLGGVVSSYDTPVGWGIIKLSEFLRP